jgi:hypothetical protein
VRALSSWQVEVWVLKSWMEDNRWGHTAAQTEGNRWRLWGQSVNAGDS